MCLSRVHTLLLKHRKRTPHAAVKTRHSKTNKCAQGNVKENQQDQEGPQPGQGAPAASPSPPAFFSTVNQKRICFPHTSDYSRSLSRLPFLQPALSGGQFQGFLPRLPSAFSQGQSRT